MIAKLKIFTLFLLCDRLASSASSYRGEIWLPSLLTDAEEDPRQSRNFKRSPLEVGFVSFELERNHGGSTDIPTIVRQNFIVKHIPIVPKPGSIPTAPAEKDPRSSQLGDQMRQPVPQLQERDVPVVRKIEVIHPKVIVDRKEITVDHAANVVLHQKHVLLEQPLQTKAVLLRHDGPLVLRHSFGAKSMIIPHTGHEAIFVDHKPQFSGHPRHENRKAVFLRGRKSIVLGLPRHPTTMSVLVSPKSQIREIIVQRHDPKTLPRPAATKNTFRSHYGGFGVGVDYGGHGAGHGFYVPVSR